MSQRFLLKSLDDGAQKEITGQVIAGRNPDCGLRLPEGGPEGGPSRRHALLWVEESALWVEDQRSTNGTFVNDERVAGKTRLRLGDRLRFDCVAYVVCAPTEEAGESRMRSPAPPRPTAGPRFDAALRTAPQPRLATPRPAPAMARSVAEVAERPVQLAPTPPPAAAASRITEARPIEVAPPPPQAAVGSRITEAPVRLTTTGPRPGPELFELADDLSEEVSSPAEPPAVVAASPVPEAAEPPAAAPQANPPPAGPRTLPMSFNPVLPEEEAVPKSALRESQMPGAWADPAAGPVDGKTVLVSPDRYKDTMQPAKGLTTGKVDEPTLTCLSGGQAGQRFKLAKLARRGEKVEWSLGSDPSQDVVLTGDGVSAQHACIVNEGERWKIIDRLSSNGTFVNNRRSNSSFLSSGDHVRLGTVECVLELPPSYAAVPRRVTEVAAAIPRSIRRPPGQRVDSRTLMISFAVTAAILAMVWRFFLS